jgi:hypothetical protein
MAGSIKLENGNPGPNRQKARPYLQNIQNKKSWRHGSSGRVPAQQVRSRELKPQYCQKKKKKKVIEAKAVLFRT